MGSVLPNELGTPYIQNYSPEEYGENPMNWGMVQDNRGIIYVANLNGILEFDGVSWRVIKTPKETWVLSVAVDSTGTVFAGSFGDFGYLAPDSVGNLQFVSLLEKVEPGDRDFAEIWRTHCTSEGTYFRTRDKLFLWSNNQLKVLGSKSSLSLSSVVNDTVYVEERDKGLMKTVGDSLVLIPDSERLNPMGFVAMTPYDHYRKLVFTTKGLFLFDGKTFSSFASPVNAFIRENILSSAVALPGGKFAIGTYRGGACIIDKTGRVLQVLNISSGLRNEDVKNLYCDPQGTLWMALNSGIARVQAHDPATFFSERQGLKGNVVSVTRHRGILYAATSQSVYYLESDLSILNTSPEKSGIHIPAFKSVEGISNQGFWLLSVRQWLLAATADGVYQIDGTRARLVNSGRESSFVLHQSKRDTNVVYVGLKNGMEVLKLENQRWTSTGRVKGIGEEIRTIVEEKDGGLWLGTIFQGVLHVRLTSHDSKGWNADVDRFNRSHGLPDGPANISRINGSVVFATKKGHRRFTEGDQYFDPDSTIAAELADTTLSAAWVEEDRFGQVFVWPVNEEGKSEPWMAIPQRSGGYLIDKKRFRSIMNLGLIHTTYTDNDSIIWIGCSNGLVRYDSRITKHFSIDYPTQIRRVATVSGDSLIFGGISSPKPMPQVLPYRNRALRFEYTVPHFEEVSENRYQYFLGGFDEDWSDWTRETQKDYTNLPAGQYIFRVRAKNIYGNLSREDHFRFEILAPWYQSWWAYAGYFVLFLAVVYVIDRVQRSRLVKRELEKAKLREAEIISQKNLELNEKNKELQFVLQKLQSAQDSLIDSESRFRAVAESANDAIITSDITGRIIFWNKHAETIFGYSKKEAVGQPLTMLMPEKHHKAHREGLDRFLRTGKSRIIGQVVELEAMRKDGTEFPIELTLADWETHDAKFVTGIIRDITKRKQEQAELEKTQVRLFQSEKLASLGKLTAGIAHEINTPLGAIKSNADVSARCIAKLEEFLERSKTSTGVSSGNEYEKFVNLLKKNSRISSTASDRIAKILNSLKNFTRLDEAGYQKTDLHESIENTLSLIEHEINDQTSVVREYGEIPLVECYPGEINQVFMNLLTNAVQAIEGEGTITISTYMENGYVHVQIVDTGVGIASERIKGLFDPAFTAKESRVKTGLGLYTSYTLVQKHHGQIKVKSEVDKGSTFTVILPKDPKRALKTLETKLL
ncbi:MAG: PAS domain S-box protein [Phycisphaerae bacterium]|nr:PAS domain S-box protein [candidate division KSB1 bacterium]NIU99851.1 PAS domain S-box protein [Phycisphaerae bacterium]NIR68933.1 PAS domain S-box protein [candidate division KSB1 bacterium]NIT69436.1 PAS domain S-box protein [candidate division KSB1 bacterium]NIU23091.1 PAS domain S-box protein [candidate division KSB1 bacterium]